MSRKQTQVGLKPHTKAMIDNIQEVGSLGYSKWNIFRDFVALAALSLRNVIGDRDSKGWAEREQEYLQIIGGYKPKAQIFFPELLGQLILALEQKPADVLGDLYMQLDLGNAWSGQFFTPDHICDLMSRIIAGAPDNLPADGFVTIQDPACGAGAMIISYYNSMLEAGYNPQQQLYASAIDVDITAVHMTYIQLTLLHIPAIVSHGNSLSMEMHSHWPTLSYVMGRWEHKLNSQEGKSISIQEVPLPEAQQIVLPTAKKERPVYKYGEQLSLFG